MNQYEIFTHIAALLSLALYTLVATFKFAQLIRQSESKILSRFSTILFSAALFLHTASLVGVLITSGGAGMRDGADYFFWGAWGLAVLYAVLLKRLNFAIFGAFLIPAVILLMSLSSYLLHRGIVAQEPSAITVSGTNGTLPEILLRNLAIFHAVPSCLAIVALALALVVSTVFLITERKLKSKVLSLSGTKPPNLQTLDIINQRLVKLGFFAISFVVLSGSLWAILTKQQVFSLDLTVVSSLLVWIVLALILALRSAMSLSPKQTARMTIAVSGFFFFSVLILFISSGRMSHAPSVLTTSVVEGTK